MSGFVSVGREGPVLVVTLDRPARHNALVPEMLSAVADAVEDAGRAATVGAVVLAANGASFSTGGDVRGFVEATDLAAYADLIVGELNRAILAMMRFPAPVIAAVHGAVTGGSLGLVLGADIVLVGPRASFTPWYGPVGFSPDGGWTAILPDIIGRGRTASILLENRTISADEAVEWGLAAQKVVDGDVAGHARRRAESIANNAAGSNSHTKQLVHGDVAEVGRRLEAERRRFVEQITTEEAAAGMVAFLARNRSPRTGRASTATS